MIYNTYDQIKQAVEDGIIPKSQAVAIGYGSNDSRSMRSSRWVVWSPFFKTDPGAAWYNNGSETFLVQTRSVKKQMLDTAKAWASEKYGITEWACNRQHDWVPKIVNDVQPIPRREE